MQTPNDAVFRLIPKVLGLVAVLPIAIGLTWLTWQVTQDTLEMTREWPLVEVEVVAIEEGVLVHLAVSDASGRREVTVPRSGTFKTVEIGERFAAYADPGDPDNFQRAGGADVWGVVGVVGFFAVACYGILAYLLLVKPLRMPPELLPAAAVADLVEEEPERRADDLAPIVLKPAARRWKAARFWALVGLLALLAVLLAGDAEDLVARGVAGCLALVWTVGFGRTALVHRSLQMRAEQDRLVIKHLFGQREIELGRVREVRRVEGDPGAFQFNDAEGQGLFRLDADTGPAESLTRFLRRMDARIQMRSRFRS